MKILAFDTSYGKCSVAISNGHQILATEYLHDNSQQAEKIVILIENALAKAACNYSDLDYVAVTTGPGSFTGIRIGLATARGILLSTKALPIAISTFEIINFRIKEQIRNHQFAISVVNAYRDQIYYQIFDIKNNKSFPPQMIYSSDFADVLMTINGKIAVSGSGTSCIIHNLNNDCTILPRFPFPDARIMCRLAQSNLLLNQFNSDIDPLYIRPPDAKAPKHKS
jgi:tRNA threonylcarbamoyladenosine biosynthesis protein TsaB